MSGLEHFFDEQGRLTVWPAKSGMREQALRHLARRFAFGRFYTEKEVGAALSELHTFGDFAMLRRALADRGLLCRTPDGARYWRGDFLTGADFGTALCARPMRAGDENELLAVHATLPEYDGITGETFCRSDAAGIVGRGDLPPGGRPEFFCARVLETAPGQTAGYLVCYEGYPDAATLWIGSLFLAMPHHRRGLGAQVLTAVRAQAKEAGFARVGLGVYAGNTAGLRFWVSQGFRTIDRVTESAAGKAVLALGAEL